MNLENVQDIYPLSPMQTGMLFHAIEAAEPGLYLLQLRVTLEGPLHLDHFQAAWGEVVQRHEALRAAFLWEGLDEPLQVIRERVETPWRLVDAREMQASEGPDAVQAWLLADRAEGFDLKQAPLMRVTLLDFGDDRWRFVWTFHHLLADAWSMTVVLRELHAIYHARMAGREADLAPAPAYRDVVAWHRGRDLGAAKPFWRGYLANFTAPLQLDFPRPPTPGPAGDRSLEEVVLPGPLATALSRLARERRVTPAALYYVAWALTLSRHTLSDDVVFGTVFSGRGHGIAGAEGAVGLYINTVPVRVRLDREATVGELVDGVHADLLQLRRFEHTPLGRIGAWSELPPGTSLFDSMLVVENHPPLGCDEGDVVFRDFDPMDQSDFPLSVFVIPGETSKLLSLFDPAEIDSTAMQRLLHQFATVLEALPALLAQPALELETLPVDERERLDALAHGPAVARSGDQNVLASIARQAHAAPDSLALVSGGESLSYEALARRAAGFAQFLEGRGLGAGDRIGILLDRGCDVVVAMLGVLQSGAAYIPLDMTYPAPRLRAMLADCSATAVITTDTHAAAADLDTDQVIHLDAMDRAVTDERPPLSAFGATRARGEDLAYVMVTSGSTGRPKGVAVSHDNLLYSTEARWAFYAHDPRAFLLLSSFAFDSSVAGLYWTLSRGGTLVISEPRLEQDVQALTETIASHGITHTLCLPSLYDILLEYAPPQQLASLKSVIVAGEAVAAGVVSRHREVLPGVSLFNEYGPTEGTVWCTACELTGLAEPAGQTEFAGRGPGPGPGTEARNEAQTQNQAQTRTKTGVAAPPIGSPIPGAEVRLFLDDTGRLAPLGAVGELWVGGPGVAQGYFERPDETAEAFVTASKDGRRWYRTGDLGRYRADGLIEFLGRRDGQVKIRGHRIEMGELEAVLRDGNGVSDACVIAALGDGQGDVAPRRLVAFVTHAPGRVADPAALLERCREQLPRYMVPASIEPLAAFPQLPNGKVDRDALSRLAADAHADDREDAPLRDEIERGLAAIWQDVLGVEQVGRHDDFFALGGDSLSSIRIVARAGAEGFTLAPSELFEFPTIADLARIQRRIRAGEDDMATGHGALRHDQTGQGGPGQGDAGQGTPGAQTPGDDAAETDHAPAFFMVHGGRRIHEALAARFHGRRTVHLLADHRDSGAVAPFASVKSLAADYIAEIDKRAGTSPKILGGYSIGAPIAVEIGRQLQARGEPAPLVFLLDPPDDAGYFADAGGFEAAGVRPERSTQDPRQQAATGANRNAPSPMPRSLSILLGTAARSLGMTVPLNARRRYVPWVYDRALRRHALRPYDGPLLIFHGTDAMTDASGKTLWEHVGGGDVHTVSFDALHTEFVRNPSVVDAWTARLAEALENPINP